MKFIIDELEKIGVKKIVSCPGGRNQPLLDFFQNNKNFNVESFFDERSASFFALGEATKGSPVAVVTTSGTAVAECLSAVIEAKYQNNLPLIILSADRPRDLRYTGSPQTIPQQNIFVDFVNSSFDIDEEEKEISLESIKYPAHINICIKEPNPIRETKALFNIKDLVILSNLKCEQEFIKAKEMLKSYKGVIVLEALSNFKEEDFKNAVVVRIADQFFKEIGLESFKRAFRLGSVPVLKVWREIDKIESFYLEGYFKGSKNSQSLSLNKIKELIKNSDLEIEEFNKLKKINNNINQKNKELINKYPNSEVSQIFKLVNTIPKSALVFIGNSLPVRELQYTDFDRGFKLFGQRGVNGIDGSLSFALGAANDSDELWVILGDLTCLYDMQGFWPLLKNKDLKLRLVVINNEGGQIFKKIFNKDYMLNSHNLNFSHLAAFWKIDYQTDFKNIDSQKVLIELSPDTDASQKFWDEF